MAKKKRAPRTTKLRISVPKGQSIAGTIRKLKRAFGKHLKSVAVVRRKNPKRKTPKRRTARRKR